MDVIRHIRTLVQQGNCDPAHEKSILSALDLWEHRDAAREDCFAFRTAAAQNLDTLMTALAEADQVPVSTCFGAALSALELQNCDLAERLFRQLPERYQLPGWRQICHFYRRFPVGNPSYAALVPAMWEAFRQRDADIYRSLESSTDYKALAPLRDIFHAQTSPFNFAIGRPKDGIEIKFSVTAAAGDIFPMLYLAEHAPAALHPRWRFQAGMDLTLNQPVEISGHPCALKSFQYACGPKGTNRHIPIHVYNKELALLAAEDSGEAQEIANRAVSYALGEIPAMRHLSPIQVETEPLGPSSRTLDRLVYDIGPRENINLCLSARRHLETSSSSAIQCKPPAGLRSDIRTSFSCFPELLQEYQTLRSDIFNNLLTQGVAAGFVFFPTRLCVGNTRKHFTLLTQQIRDAAEGEIFITGTAVGVKFCYIDFVAYDFRKVLSALQKVFHGIKGGEAAHFASFYPGAKPASLDADREIAAFECALAQFQGRQRRR